MMLDFLHRLTAPPAQALRTLRPTSSTVSYTVSTRPIPKSIPARLGFYISILLRLLAGLLTLVVIWTKWRVSCDKSTDLLLRAVGSEGELFLVGLAESSEWRYLAPGALCVLWMVFRRGYTEESLTLLRGLGVQTSTSSSTYLQTPATRFIPTTSIQDIFIHEAFKGFEVRFYLSIVVKGEKDVVVVFPTLLPRRTILEEVWRGARSCLWETSGEEKPKNMSNIVSL